MALKERLSKVDLNKFVLPLVLFVIFVGLVIGIVNYQTKARLNTPPKLEVNGPANGSVTEDSQVVVDGNTNQNAKVKINGEDVSVDSKGNFAKEVPLKEGENSIGIVAENSNGKKSESTLKVTRNVPVVQTQQVAASTATGSELNNSGPEDYWIIGSLLLAGTGLAWHYSRRSLKSTITGN